MGYAIDNEVVAWWVVVPDASQLYEVGGHFAIAAFIDVLYERVRKCLFALLKCLPAS